MTCEEINDIKTCVYSVFYSEIYVKPLPHSHPG